MASRIARWGVPESPQRSPIDGSRERREIRRQGHSLIQPEPDTDQSARDTGVLPVLERLSGVEDAVVVDPYALAPSQSVAQRELRPPGNFLEQVERRRHLRREPPGRAGPFVQQQPPETAHDGVAVGTEYRRVDEGVS